MRTSVPSAEELATELDGEVEKRVVVTFFPIETPELEYAVDQPPDSTN
jgi:hypothetical protein